MPKYKSLAILFTVLSGIVGTSYVGFTKFKPDLMSKVEQVKGITSATSTSMEIPYPKNYKIIGIDKNSEGQTINFKVMEPSQKIQVFYKNALTSLGWEIEHEGTEGSFMFAKYKKDDKFITVNSSSQENSEYTVVVIDVSDRK